MSAAACKSPLSDLLSLAVQPGRQSMQSALYGMHYAGDPVVIASNIRIHTDMCTSAALVSSASSAARTAAKQQALLVLIHVTRQNGSEWTFYPPAPSLNPPVS